MQRLALIIPDCLLQRDREQTSDIAAAPMESDTLQEAGDPEVSIILYIYICFITISIIIL